jgi:hypothetical protein
MEPADVESLRIAYNREHPGESQIGRGDTKHIWSEIRKRLHKKCNDRLCIAYNLLEKPKAPSSWKTDPDQWLTTTDIDKFEKKLMKTFGSYYYVDTVPIDFGKKSETGKCLVNSLCSMKIENIADKGKTRIGIVFNTDLSTGTGEHWIAAFCDIRPTLDAPIFVFFDSYAEEPEPEILELMNSWKSQWDQTGRHKKPMILEYNSLRHQYENTECGMYCLLFHYCCILGIPLNKRVPDKVVRGFRNLFFQ